MMWRDMADPEDENVKAETEGAHAALAAAYLDMWEQVVSDHALQGPLHAPAPSARGTHD